MNGHVRHKLTIPGIAALVMIGVAVLTVIVGALPVVRLLLDRDGSVESGRLTSDDGEIDLSSVVAQIDGRTAFFVPDAPAPPKPKPKPVVRETPKDPPPKPPPAKYGGPAIVAMIDGRVWFKDGKQLRSGEDDGGIGVRRINAPWGAVIEWKGVEFDVPLFEKDDVVVPGSSDEQPSAMTSQREEPEKAVRSGGGA